MSAEMAARSVIAPYRSPRGKSVSSVQAWLPMPLGRQHYTKKPGLRSEISRRDFSAAGPSGLSLPDAPCEHTNIRASVANLTREVEKLKVPAADTDVSHPNPRARHHSLRIEEIVERRRILRD